MEGFVYVNNLINIMGGNDSLMLPEQHSHVVRFTVTHAEFPLRFDRTRHAKNIIIVEPLVHLMIFLLWSAVLQSPLASPI